MRAKNLLCYRRGLVRLVCVFIYCRCDLPRMRSVPTRKEVKENKLKKKTWRHLLPESAKEFYRHHQSIANLTSKVLHLFICFLFSAENNNNTYLRKHMKIGHVNALRLKIIWLCSRIRSFSAVPICTKVPRPACSWNRHSRKILWIYFRLLSFGQIHITDNS